MGAARGWDKFASFGALQLHKKGHTVGDKNHTCNVCGSAFSSGQFLRLHKNRAHLNEMDFVCQMCSMSFAHKRGLQRHMRRKVHKNYDKQMI